MADGRFEINEPRPARFVWVWRGFFVIAVVAAVIAGLLAAGGITTFAVVWGVIAVAWAAIGLWLRRMHANMDAHEFRRLRP